MRRNYKRLGESLDKFTTESGLRVLVCRRPGFSRSTAYLSVDFGAIDRAFSMDGKKICPPAGTAHFLEHTMFDLPDRDVSGEFAALGASVNAFTSYDMTCYYFSCAGNFCPSLKLLLEFVGAGYFTEETVAREQGIIAQEIAMAADQPDSRVFENLMAAMYRRHPVNTPILGTEADIARITPTLLEDCHRAFYRPENMVLCVAGDVEENQIRALAEAAFPPDGRPRVRGRRAWPEAMTPARAEVIHTADVPMPTFQLGFKAEPVDRGFASLRREMTAELAAEALFGESSRLYLKLYDAGLIDSSFGGGFESLRGAAMVTCGGDSRDPAAVRDMVLREAGRIAREGIHQGDFRRMVKSALGRRIRGLDNFGSTCFRLGACRIAHTDYFQFPAAYDGLRPQDIQAFLAQVVTGERCCLSVLLPEKEETIC